MALDLVVCPPGGGGFDGLTEREFEILENLGGKGVRIPLTGGGGGGIIDVVGGTPWRMK